jgi:hypothetical protein
MNFRFAMNTVHIRACSMVLCVSRVMRAIVSPISLRVYGHVHIFVYILCMYPLQMINS